MPFNTTPQDHTHTWKQIQHLDSLKRTQQQFGNADGLHQDMPQNRTLPNGFVPLQPVSTTEVWLYAPTVRAKFDLRTTRWVFVQDSFSYHESKGSKPRCMMSHHTNQESAWSQETMTNDDLADSPAFQAVSGVEKHSNSAMGIHSR